MSVEVSLEPLWDVQDSARYLKLSTKTVYRMAAAGSLPCVKVGGALRFIPDHVRRWAVGESVPARSRAVVPLYPSKP